LAENYNVANNKLLVQIMLYQIEHSYLDDRDK